VKSIDLKPESLWKASSFRHMLAGSVATHGLLFAVIGFSPGVFWSSPPPPMPLMVQVVSAAPKAPAPPPPAPAPAPEPPAEVTPPTPTPRQQVDEAIVIPRQPREKPRPKKPKPAEKPKKPDKPPPSAADLMAQLRESAESIDTPSEQTQDGDSAVGLDPELAAYYRKVKGCLDANWVGAQQYQRRRDLSVRFRVRLSAAGMVESVKLVQGSGIRMLDETAERAIYKCQPLPLPPGNQSVIPLNFVPGDVQ